MVHILLTYCIKTEINEACYDIINIVVQVHILTFNKLEKNRLSIILCKFYDFLIMGNCFKYSF